MQEQYDKLTFEKKIEIEEMKANFDTDKVVGKSDQEAIVSTGIFLNAFEVSGGLKRCEYAQPSQFHLTE